MKTPGPTTTEGTIAVRVAKRQPRLAWHECKHQLAMDDLALAHVGKPELAHPLNVERIDMAHAVIACGQCGGVYGGDGVVVRNGVVRGRCPTARCTCKGRLVP